jgi:hypothetical protein
MRTEELATSAMALDKVELCNRQINVGRPKGYVEPPGGHAPPATLASAQIFAAQLAKAPSRVLLLKNMLKARALLDEQERTDVRTFPPSLPPRVFTLLIVRESTACARLSSPMFRKGQRPVS